MSEPGTVDAGDLLRRLLESQKENDRLGAEVERLRARLAFLEEIDQRESSGWCGEHPRRFAANAREGDEGSYDECQKCRAEQAEARLARVVEALRPITECICPFAGTLGRNCGSCISCLVKATLVAAQPEEPKL